MKSPSLPFTSVVSLHTDPYSCGVARFSKQLAERLGVPFVGLSGEWGNHALLSLKWREIEDHRAVLINLPVFNKYSVFWHDTPSADVNDRAEHVFYADPSLGSPGLWCPSLLTPSKPRTVKLFSFGMAHKLQTQYYQRVRELLDAAGIRYHLRVSVGLHEGTSLSDATQHFDALKDIMGPENVTILGILSDDAVSEELCSADYVLAFFEHGARLNNTTLHAALDSLTPVISNLGTGTPERWQDRVTFIEHLAEWPAAKSPYTWEGLISEMQTIYENSTDRQSVNR